MRIRVFLKRGEVKVNGEFVIEQDDLALPTGLTYKKDHNILRYSIYVTETIASVSTEYFLGDIVHEKNRLIMTPKGAKLPYVMFDFKEAVMRLLYEWGLHLHYQGKSYFYKVVTSNI